MSKLPTKEHPITGTFQATSKGFGFLVREDGGEDFFLPPHATGGAWHGDKVAVLPDLSDPFDPRRSTARVVEILERANKVVIGTLRRSQRVLFLQPDSDKLPPIQLTAKGSALRAGEKAAVEVLRFGNSDTVPLGRALETFGPSGTRDAAVAAILYHYEIDPAFPPDVLAQADSAPEAVPAEALDGRLDLREECLITIDGESAKDLDDAVSLTREDDGTLTLGVHIADVSHYVPEGSPLDLEAWERGNSVYFADRVIPMLPTALSNGICSLNPQVDRLAISCLMRLTPGGEILSHSLHKSVIRTAERMTYEDCNLLLAAEDSLSPALLARRSALCARYAAILPMLKAMAALAAALKRRRALRGSLDLTTRECYILCDSQGRAEDVVLRTGGVSEALIESFMLLANETVAQHLFEAQKPAVYRVHEKPSQDKAEGLKTMLAPFGYALHEADGFSLQKLLDAARGTPEEPLINDLVLRSLMKARYDAVNLGHFGLAAPYYCHFTSPIRRYSDLMVHRILTLVLADGAAGEGRTMPWEKRMAAQARRAAVQASEREIAGQNAEREIEKLYLAEFMAGHLGEEFQGAVSGVVKSGLFIMLTSGVEGFLPREALPHDRWHFDPERRTLRGEFTQQVFSFGMALTVLCTLADPGSGQIDFALPGAAASPAGPRARGGKRDIKPPKSRAPHRSKPPRHKPGKRKGKR